MHMTHDETVGEALASILKAGGKTSKKKMGEEVERNNQVIIEKSDK